LRVLTVREKNAKITTVTIEFFFSLRTAHQTNKQTNIISRLDEKVRVQTCKKSYKSLAFWGVGCPKKITKNKSATINRRTNHESIVLALSLHEQPSLEHENDGTAASLAWEGGNE